MRINFVAARFSRKWTREKGWLPNGAGPQVAEVDKTADVSEKYLRGALRPPYRFLG